MSDVGNRRISADVVRGRRGAGDRVVAIDQHAAGLADRVWPEPGAGRFEVPRS